jgi:hypothetical protein
MANVRKALLSTGLALVTMTSVSMTSAPSALASGGGDEVIKQGTCTQGGTWKLKGKHDDGRLQIEFEVDTNRVGQTFSVRLTDNGVTFFSGSRTTLAPSGSFEVNRLPVNRAGSDVIRARAVRGTNVCAGSITL